MAMSLNVKSAQNGFSLFGHMFQGTGNLFARDCLQNCDIWYQQKGFDMLITVDLDGSELLYCARIEYDKTGQLMSGMLGNKPMLEFTKSFKYLFKAILVNIENCADSKINQGLSELKGQTAVAKHGLYSNYANFLVMLGDTKAIPKDMKSDISETPSPVGLDFNKLEGKMAAMYAVGDADFTKEETTIVSCKGTGTPVPLCHAEALGQAVRGTSEGSVYYVAAISSIVALAYRFDINAKRLSIRVEPRKSTKLNIMSSAVSALKDAELITQAEGDNLKYASLHLQIDNAKSARRVLGAVIFDTLLFKPAGVNLEVKVT